MNYLQLNIGSLIPDTKKNLSWFIDHDINETSMTSLLQLHWIGGAKWLIGTTLNPRPYYVKWQEIITTPPWEGARTSQLGPQNLVEMSYQ